MHYNQMMRLYNGEFDPYNPPPMQNPYASQPRPQNPMPHANIAQFGSPNFQNQFYGQSFPTNQPTQGFQVNQGGQFPIQGGQGGLFPSSSPQQPNQPGFFSSNPFNGRQWFYRWFYNLYIILESVANHSSVLNNARIVCLLK